MPTDDDAPVPAREATARLRAAMRAQLRGGAATLQLTAADAQLVLQELGRLQQANDRLRRQNRRLRRRHEDGAPDADGLGVDVDVDGGDATTA